MSESNEKKISVIIPCRNEGLKIKQTADLLLHTEAGARNEVEIIVVDDGSKDRCCSFLEGETSFYKNYKKFNLFTTKGVGAAKARNLGAEKARGRSLFFVMPTFLCKKAGSTYC